MRSKLFLYIFLISISAVAQQLPRLEMQKNSQGESLRGLNVFSDDMVWASGTGGTFLRTLDGGESWEAGKVSGCSGFLGR